MCEKEWGDRKDHANSLPQYRVCFLKAQDTKGTETVSVTFYFLKKREKWRKYNKTITPKL